MTDEEVLESNRGTPDGSSEGESKLSGFVEKGVHDPLHGTEVKPLDESIITIEVEEKYSTFSINRVVVDNKGGSIAKDDIIRETNLDKTLSLVVDVVRQGKISEAVRKSIYAKVR